MRCDEVMEYMQRELDSDLSVDETRDLNEHLHTCTECQSFYEHLKQVSLDLENLPDVEPPLSIVDQILPGLEREFRTEGQGQSINPKALLWKKWSLVAGGLAAVFCVWVLTENSYSPDIKHTELSMQKANDHPLHAKTSESYNQQSLQAPEHEQKVTDEMKDRPSMAAVEQGTEPKQTAKEPRVTENSLALAPKTDHIGQPQPQPKLYAEPNPVPSEDLNKSKVEKKETSDLDKSQGATPPSIAVAKESADGESPSIAGILEENEEMNQTLTSLQTEEIGHEGMEDRFASPGGVWLARIEGNAIVVLERNGLEVFRSHSWEEGLRVSVKWTDDNRLEYRLESNEAKTKTAFQPEIWTVNVEEGQEHKQ